MPGEAGSSRRHMAAMEEVFLGEEKSWRSSAGWMEVSSPAEEALVWHLPTAVSVVTASPKRPRVAKRTVYPVTGTLSEGREPYLEAELVLMSLSRTSLLKHLWTKRFHSLM